LGAGSAPQLPDSGHTEATVLPWANGMRLEALGNLAHELRTPLQVLLGYLDILRDEYVEQLGSQTREILERMNANLHELALTVDNLMDFVLTEANARSSADEDLTIESLMADLTPLIEAANQRKQLTIKLELDDAATTIRAPRRAIRSILSNLALNAIKFTEKGSVTIAIRQRGSERQGIEVEIRDTGSGLTPTELKQATEPFTQLSRSTTRRHRGLGLGLAVVERNVRSLGATLDVTSTPGHGSSFIIRIPARTRREAAGRERRTPVRAPVSAPQPTPVPAKSATISRR
jgi:two-component system, cell cycle sensor histidine kinase PleC